MAKGDTRTLSIPVSGEVLRAVEARAEKLDLPLYRAALGMLEERIAADTAQVTVVTNLEAASTDDLIDELVGRLQSMVPVQLFDAAVARADSLAGQLAEIRGVLDEVRPQ